MALKASELRIGNFVTAAGWVPQIEIFGLSKLFAECVTSPERPIFEMDYEQLIGIPLTEEWLLKFGFTKEPLGFGKSIAWHKDQYKVLSFSSDYLYLREGDSADRTEDDLICLWNKDIKKQFYVHELQNLYQAITREELEIRELTA